MKKSPASLWLASVALAAALTAGGCSKSGNPPAASQTAAQPAPAATNSTAQPGNAGTTAQPAAGAQPNAPGNAQTANAAQNPSAPPAPPPPIVIPTRTRIRVRLDEPVGSKISVPGQAFSATVADDVVVNGLVVIPRGAHAVGTVVDAKPLGRIKGGALLELRLERIRTDSGNYPVATSTMERIEKGKGKRTARFAGGGGAFGAIVGGLAGGGKGALIGGLVGAGAGTAGSAMSGNKEIVLPAETLITFRLEHPVQVTQ